MRDKSVDAGIIQQPERSGVVWVLLPHGGSADFRDNENSIDVSIARTSEDLSSSF